MRLFLLVVGCALAVSVAPANAQSWALLDRALAGATQIFAKAQDALGASSMGVSTQAYGQALVRQRFRPPGQDAAMTVLFKREDGADPGCARFAAYVIPAPQQRTATIYLCPQFFQSGTDELRTTTILHEMVHVVAGPDECLAMAYTAGVQLLATGRFQPVADYWRQSGCASSPYRLPATR
jgi:hypothetical protein